MASKTINTILNLRDNFSRTIDKTSESTKKFKKHLNDAEKQADRMRQFTANAFKAIGAGVISASAGVYALVNKTAESMDVIDKMSERTGLTRERLQELQYAAGQCGVAVESIEDGVKMLTKNMGKADDESKRMTAAFQKMKISIKDGNGNLKSSSALFEESISKLADMKDQTERNILGQKIFGGSWQDMIPLINQGSSGIKTLTDRARQLGLVVSEEAVVANVVFGDTLSDVKQSLGALGTKLSNALLPYLQRFLDFMLVEVPKIEPKAKEVFGKVSQAIQDIKDNMDILIPVAGGLLATFIAFQVVTKVAAAYTKLKKATEAMTIAQALLNGTMLANPFTWIALGIGLLVAAGIALWRNWDTVKAKALELWLGIKAAFAPVGEFFSGIWSGVKEGFKGFINFIIRGINGFTGKLSWIPEKLSQVPGFAWAANFVIPKIPEFALGTQYFKGGAARTDERGGEVKIYPNGTKIIPADKSEKMLRNMNGINFSIIIQGNVIGEETYINKLGNIIASKILIQLANM